MDQAELMHARELLETHRRRKRELDLQAARRGTQTDPAITMEIEDLEREIAEAEQKLARNLPFDSLLLEPLNAIRECCAALNTPLLTPHLPVMLFDLPGGWVRSCFQRVRHDLAVDIYSRLIYYLEQVLPAQSTSGFVSFEWDERDDVRNAQRCAVRDNAPYVTHKHLLLGILLTPSNTVSQLRNMLGHDFDSLVEIITVTPANRMLLQQGTPGVIFPEEREQ